MKFEEIQLDGELLSFLTKKGFVELYPPQEKAIKAGLLDGKSLVVSSPTASGKTLIAIIAAYMKVKRDRRKVVYLAPLRALASEKYREFSELGQFGIRTSISTGDYDTSGESLGKSDIIVLTNERFDSIMRHGVSWLESVGLFIVDEVHMVGDESRGPTLEMILTKILYLDLDAQILALSATISNATEISKWLGSGLVEVNWRPVPLRQAVYDYGRILFLDGAIKKIESSSYGAPIVTAVDAIKEGGQSLIFVGTRRRAVSLAVKASEITSKFLSDDEKRLCSEAARGIRGAGEETSISNLLAEIVAKGTAFHHAGLDSIHRRIIEDYYRMRAIKLLVATPTLASGVNLPARRVIIADLARYDSSFGGSSEISILEYQQMSGRAGRPQYDEYGETIIIPPHSYSAKEILEHYAKSPPEPIKSKLSDEGAMRSHVLASIAIGSGLSMKDIEGLFGRTLLAMQVKRERISRNLGFCTRYLLENGLIQRHGELLFATEFGKRVSMLYIDPMTGVMFRDAILKMDSNKNYTTGILHLISSCPDFEPRFPLRNKDFELAVQFISEHADELITNPRKRAFIEYDEFLQCMRQTMALYAWIDEWKEEEILTRLGIEPGDLHRAVESAEWLLYSLGELAKLFGKKELTRQIEVLRRRVISGVSEELIELTTLPGIGRVRARALYTAGYRTIEDIKEAQAEKLALVEKIGTALARRLKEQVSRS